MSTALDRYLRDAGISESDFAAKINRDRSIVNKLRNGKMTPTVEVALAIEAASGREIDAGLLNPVIAAARQGIAA